MKALAIIVLLCSCGVPLPELAEGIYTVTLIETSNSCNWSNGDVVHTHWQISHIDQYYAIQASNGETLPCIEREDQTVKCDKEKTAMVGDCEWTVVQTVVMKPEEESFTGTYQADYTSCKNEICSQKTVIKGEPYTDLY